MDSENFAVNQFEPKGLATSESSVSGGILTIVTGAGGHLSSLQTNKRYGYGENAYIGVTYPTGSNTPQIHMRGADATDDAYICFLSNGVPKIRIRHNGAYTDASGVLVDGVLTSDIEARVIAFNNLLDFQLMLNGQNIGGVRINNAQDYGAHNGLGANVSTTYKSPFRAGALKTMTNIVCIGDSNTDGMYLTRKQVYPSQIQAMRFYQPVSVANFGVRGNRVADVAARLNSIIAGHVDDARNVAVLMIGTNDCTYSAPVQDTYSAIVADLVLPLQYAGFEVWLVTIPPCGSSANTNTYAMALNALIRAGTAADKLIDLAPHLMDANGDCLEWYFHSDLKHLSEEGARFLAQMIGYALDT